MSSPPKNVFQCECSPKHDFHSLEEFNQHFASVYHKYHECSSKSLYQDYLNSQKDVWKLREERDMWKNMYQEQFKKNGGSLS